MGELMSANPKRVMDALLKMGKIDIEGLRKGRQPPAPQDTPKRSSSQPQ